MAVALAVCVGSVVAYPQGAAAARAETAAAVSVALPAGQPVAWAKAATANEIAIVQHPGSYLRYRERFVDAKGDETRDVIESADGTVARLILRDGKPLTPEQDQAERDRLNSMLTHPSEFRRHVKNYAEAKNLAVSLLKLMPDAMIYTYAAGQPQNGKPQVGQPQVGKPQTNPLKLGERADEEEARQVVLDFAPNPKFRPPTTLSEALLGLRGRVWIDRKTTEVVRMEVSIFQGINFGLGMLAHISPGGSVLLEQAAASGTRWNLTRFDEHVTARVLLVKTLNLHTEVHSAGFQTIPGPISYQEAIHRLLDTPLPVQGEP